MKRGRLTRWLGGLLVTLFMAAGTGAFGECMGPYQSGGIGEPPEWAGTCSVDDVLEFAEQETWPHNGPSFTYGEDEGQGDQDRTPDPSAH